MAISLGTSAFLLALSVLAAGGASYWAYRQTTPPLARGPRLLMGSLRFLALSLILFLLFEPVYRSLDANEQPPLLAVLLDDSQSLRVTAGTTDADTSSTAPRAAFQRALDNVQEGGATGEQRYYRFGRTLQPLPSGALDSLQFEAARTDIAAALERTRDALQQDNLRGVVLVSDGQFNSGQNPLFVAERFVVPIHTIAVGDTTRRRDLQVRRVTTNDIGYANVQLPVQVGLRTEAAAGETVQVSLYRNGDRLDTTPVQLPNGTAEVPVDLSFTPTDVGLQRLTVGVTRLDDEATYRNNEQSFTVRVLESKRRILLLGAAPSPNFAATRRLLSRDENTQVVPFVPRQDGSFYQGDFPSALDDFDVIVLAGFPSSFAPPAAVAQVASAADDGTPLLFLLDRQTDLRQLRDQFGDLLPARPEQVRRSFVEAALVPTEARRSHPVFDIPDVQPDQWRRLPPLNYSETRWAASPDAQVLATIRVRDVALDDPALVLRRRAGQRSAALLATGTWRWANLPADLEALSPVWPSMLSNLVQWVATRENDQPVRVRPVQRTFAGGEPVEFTGQVYDESLNPVSDAAVTVNVIGPDSTRYPYRMQPTGNGRYRLDAGTLPEGTYAFAAEAVREGATLGSDRGQFAVGSLTLEYRNTRADAALLRQIAQRSGGSFHTVASAGDLPGLLASSEQFSSVIVTQEREQRLWHMSSFLIAIIALLAAEWALRKRNGLV